MKEYKWYKDWLIYFYYGGLILILSEVIAYYDTLVRWKWGYWSIDLIPALFILITVYFVHDKVIQERRWKAFKKLRDTK